MARPKSPDPLVVVALRLPSRVVDRIDTYARQVEAQLPGHRVNRSDAIRVLLEKALTAEGVPQPAAKPAKKGEPTKGPKR